MSDKPSKIFNIHKRRRNESSKIKNEEIKSNNIQNKGPSITTVSVKINKSPQVKFLNRKRIKLTKNKVFVIKLKTFLQSFMKIQPNSEIFNKSEKEFLDFLKNNLNLNSSHIKAFSEMKTSSEINLSVDANTNKDCTICLEEVNFNTKYYLKCGHIFHSDCIMKWLSENNNICPNCKIDLTDCPCSNWYGPEESEGNEDFFALDELDGEESELDYIEEEDFPLLRSNLLRRRIENNNEELLKFLCFDTLVKITMFYIISILISKILLTFF